MERRPYDAEHVLIRDFGKHVLAYWTEDPELARQLQEASGDEEFDRVFLNPRVDIHVIAHVDRIYKRDGYNLSGWTLSKSGLGGGCDHAGPNKAGALKALKKAIAEHFKH